MFLILSSTEKRKAEKDRNFLIELSEEIRNNYKLYLKRSEEEENFIVEKL